MGHSVIGDDLAAISKAVTGSYPAGMDEELVMRRRVGKIFVEAGELADAIEGFTGENPRKGFYKNSSDVIKELLDCASASLCAVEHMTGNFGVSVDMLEEHVEINRERLKLALG